MRTFKRNMRSAGAGIDEDATGHFLLTGLAVLGTTLLVRALLGNPGNSQVLTAISEGLLIVGWVAMWRRSKYSCLNVWKITKTWRFLIVFPHIEVGFALEDRV